MKGRIKKYNKEKGYGFIASEDGKDYFFHISDVKTIIEIELGQIVEFNIKETSKGKAASDIIIREKENCFISFQNVNIKRSNIKSYSFFDCERYFLNLYKRNPKYDGGFKAWLLVPEYVHSGERYIIEPDDLFRQKDLVKVRYYDEEEKEYVWTRARLFSKDGKLCSMKSMGGLEDDYHNFIDWDKDIGVIKSRGLSVQTYTGESYEFYEYMDKANFEKMCLDIKEI